MDYQGPERRQDNIQASLVKLVSKLETIESNIELKLDNINQKINHIEEKLVLRIEHVENKIDNHCEDEEYINHKLEEHDLNINKAKPYIDRLHNLEKKYKELEDKTNILAKEVQAIKDNPKNTVYKIVKDIGTKIMWFLLALVGLSIIFSITRPEFWLKIIQ